MHYRTALPLAFLAVVSFSLVGCETIREAGQKLTEMASQDDADPVEQRAGGASAGTAASPLRPALRVAPLSEPVGRDYQVTKSANLRGGPGIDYEVVGGLAEGAKVRVEAKVDGRNWYIVRSSQCEPCFLHASLARPLEVVQTAAADKGPVEPSRPETGVDLTLSIDEATALLIGNTVTLSSGSASANWREYYGSDNSRLVREEDGVIAEGHWKLSGGDMAKFCRYWRTGTEKQGRCFTVLQVNGEYRLMPVFRGLGAAGAVLIEEVVRGNRISPAGNIE